MMVAGATMGETHPGGVAPAPERLRSLDLYRGVAVLLMIVAHTCDAFLAERWKHGDLWVALDILFGFVAPAFLLLSGASLGIQLIRGVLATASGAAAQIPPPTRRLWRRLATTLALAYWLQIPVLSLRQLVWNHPPELLARLFDSNILHVIAICGLLTALLVRMLGVSVRGLQIGALVLAAAAFAAAPYLWHSSATADFWLPLRAFVSRQPQATFPLFPYAGYAFVGLALAPMLLTPARRRAASIAGVGVALLAAGIALDELLRWHPTHGEFWRGSIQHSFVRLGGILAALSAAMIAAMRAPARVTLLETIGQRSLAIYVLHLILVYGSPMTMGARYWLDGRFDRTLAPLEVTLAALVVATAACAAGLIWPRFRRRAPGLARILVWGWWLAFAAFFLLTP